MSNNEKEELIYFIGKVLELQRNATFKIELLQQVALDKTVTDLKIHPIIIGHAAGKIRKNRIRILKGDKVTLEMTPYDLTKGRITHRH